MVGWKFRKYTGDTIGKAIAEYFDKTPMEDWNIPDLCGSLDITTTTFYRYREDETMREACQRAIDTVNGKREKLLDNGGGSSAGIVFLLKASGYKDEQTINNKISGSIEQKVELSLEEMLADSDDEFMA